MARKQHDLEEVLRTLKKKKDLIVDPKITFIYMLKFPEAKDIGNGTWGKIDFLTKFCRYKILKVDKLPNQKELATFRDTYNETFLKNSKK